jgi:hypothetical protein
MRVGFQLRELSPTPEARVNAVRELVRITAAAKLAWPGVNVPLALGR